MRPAAPITSEFICQAAGCRQALRHGLEQGHRLHQQEPGRRRANISPRNTFHPGQRWSIWFSMLGYTMVKDMTPKQLENLQQLSDFGHLDRRRSREAGRHQSPLQVLRVPTLQVAAMARTVRQTRGPRRRGPRRMSRSAGLSKKILRHYHLRQIRFRHPGAAKV